MNKNILNKLAQFEKNVELSEVKVDLALIDDLKNILNKAKVIQAGMNDNYLEALKMANQGVQLAKQHLKNLDDVSKLVNTIKSQADDLGLDVTKNKDWQNGFDFLHNMSKNATDVLIKKLESLK